MKIKENNKGITLVALVVTIIVLLILAGITISLTIGNNGLFKRAGNATKEYENERIEEANRLLGYEETIEDIEIKGSIIYHVDNEITYQEKAKKGKNALEPTSFKPEKEGWIFEGWRENNEAISDILIEKTADGNNLELYAVFKKEVSISYNANGGSSTPTTQKNFKYYNNGNKAGANFKISAAISRPQYTFLKWRLNSISGTEYNASSNITLEDNATLYAEWKYGETYSSLLFKSEGAYCNSINHNMALFTVGMPGTSISSWAETGIKYPLGDYSKATLSVTISGYRSEEHATECSVKIGFKLTDGTLLQESFNVGAANISKQLIFDISSIKQTGVVRCEMYLKNNGRWNQESQGITINSLVLE